MSRQANLYEAKTQISRLVDDAGGGETIVIAKGGKPMAKLAPIDVRAQGPRKLGQLAGQSKEVDWARWWREWKAADPEIESDFEASAKAPLPTSHSRRRKVAR